MIASEKSKTLLKQLKDKTIDLKEFLLECAYWAAREGFDELVPKDYPLRPPKATELDNMPIKTKQDFDWAKAYIDFPEVKTYIDGVWSVKNWNKHTRDWLVEILTFIPVDDYVTREKVNKRLLQFDALTQDPLVKTITDTFSAKEV